MKRSSWRCSRGWHAWMFVSMRDARAISIPGHTFHVCTLTETCARCRLTRTVSGADVPKRPRTRPLPPASTKKEFA